LRDDFPYPRGPSLARRRGGGRLWFFEDMQVGQRREVGSFTFSADGIKSFAAQFDPQPFHLDEAAGRNLLFGGLAASGWHVASVCMKLIVADAQRLARDAAARGEPAFSFLATAFVPRRKI
jgi:acyl dehydratase